MRRVAVVGCPGSGKSTFTRKMAAKTGLPAVYLDFYHHQLMYNYYNDLPAWIARVKELIKADQWVMDGNYNSSIEPRFQRADTIIFFDFPRRVSLYGVIKRRFEYRNKRRLEMPSDWEEHINWEFLKFVWNFRKNNRQVTLNAIEKFSTKEVRIFTNHTQANNYIDGLSNALKQARK